MCKSAIAFLCLCSACLLPRAVALETDSQIDASVYAIPLSTLERAKALRSAGNYEESKAVGKKLYEVARSTYDKGDDSAINLYLLGESAALTDRYFLAARYLRLAIEAAPSYLDARLALAEALIRNGKPAEAVAALEAGETYFTDEPRYDFALAVSLERAGRIDEAITTLEAVVDAHPEARLFSSKLIEFYMSAGDVAKAEPLFEPLVAAGEVSWADAYAILADSLLRREDVNTARAYLRKAQRADASHPSLDRLFARLYDLQGETAREEGQLSRALLFWNRALEHTPDAIDLRVKVGSTLVEMGSFEEAYSVLAALTKSAPSDPVFYISLAKALRGKGDAKRAYEILEGASRIMRRDGNLEAALRFERTLAEFAREDSKLLEGSEPSATNPPR